MQLIIAIILFPLLVQCNNSNHTNNKVTNSLHNHLWLEEEGLRSDPFIKSEPLKLPVNKKSSKQRRSSPSNDQFPSYEQLRLLSKNITTILDAFSKNYDKRVRPNYGANPVEVGVTMYVLSISSISEVLMDFTVDFYFRQMWKDPRLQFHGPEGVKTLSVGSEFLKTMWVPDTFFVNEKTSYFHTATTSNEFLRISHEGDILRSIRLTVTASCPMDLRHFPMDSQLCNIEIESFGYTMSDIRYKWAKGAGSVGVSNEVSLPQFKVLGYRQKAFEISLSTGNYSRLACEIQFVRSMGYYLIQIYIPSSLIVVISWVSFWLNRNAAPARVYLGITTVLTMTTLMSSTNKALPKISYVKSIDVFLGTCFVMVFAALLEYATVGYLAKRIQMRKNHFAALQKMALQLQTAREEHFQAQQRQQAAANEAIRSFHMRTVNHFQPLNNNPVQPSTSYSTAPRTPSFNHPQGQQLPQQQQGFYGQQSGTLPPGGQGYRYAPQEHFQQSQSKSASTRNLFVEEPPQPAAPQPQQENNNQKIRQLIPINPNQICGITPSDIDKYSRVVFPVCFVCFNMLYWIIYLHISNVDPGDLTLVNKED